MGLDPSHVHYVKVEITIHVLDIGHQDVVYVYAYEGARVA